MARLGAGAEAERAAGARALGARGDPAAVPALVRALRDPAPGVRSAVAAALGALGGRPAMMALFLALEDSVPGVRAAALAALRVRAREATEVLAPRVLGPRPASAALQATFVALGPPAAERAVLALVAEYRRKPAFDEEIGVHRMGDSGVVDEFLRDRLVRDPSIEEPRYGHPLQDLVLRFGAAAAPLLLEQIREKHRIAEVPFRDHGIAGARATLIDLGAAAVPLLLQTFRNGLLAERAPIAPPTPPPSRPARPAPEPLELELLSAVRDILREMGPAPASAVAGLLVDPSRDVRLEAINLLGWYLFHASLCCRGPAADPVPSFRDAGPFRAITARLALAFADRDADLRGRAVELVGKYGAATVVTPITVLLRDRSSDVRTHAAQALERLRALEARGSLCGAIRTEAEASTLAAMLAALWRVGADLCAPVVLALARHPERDVRAVVARIAGTLDSAEALGVLRAFLAAKDMDVQEEAAEAAVARLIRRPDPDLQARVRHLLHPHPVARFRRFSVAVALGRLGDATALPALIQLQGEKELSVEFWRAAIDGVGLIASPAGLRVVERAGGTEGEIACLTITGRPSPKVQAFLKPAPSCARFVALFGCYLPRVAPGRRWTARAPFLALLERATSHWSSISPEDRRALEADCARALGSQLVPAVKALRPAAHCVRRGLAQ